MKKCKLGDDENEMEGSLAVPKSWKLLHSMHKSATWLHGTTALSLLYQELHGEVVDECGPPFDGCFLCEGLNPKTSKKEKKLH
jgi:hypothetical protein